MQCAMVKMQTKICFQPRSQSQRNCGLTSEELVRIGDLHLSILLPLRGTEAGTAESRTTHIAEESHNRKIAPQDVLVAQRQSTVDTSFAFLSRGLIMRLRVAPRSLAKSYIQGVLAAICSS